MKELAYETMTLVAIVLIFNFLELTRPAHEVNRKLDLKLNIFALFLTAVAGEVWKPLILISFNAMGMDKMLFISGFGILPGLPKVILALLAADFCLYWVHYAMHRPPLWRTHAFHHSIPELWWLSGARTSTTHLFLFAIPQILIGYYVLRLSPAEAGVAFSIGIIINVWIHANIRVNLGKLEWVLITPNFHRVHHGSKGYTRKNLGFILTVWDRMFGTFADPKVVGKDLSLLAVPTKDKMFRMMLGL